MAVKKDGVFVDEMSGELIEENGAVSDVNKTTSGQPDNDIGFESYDPFEEQRNREDDGYTRHEDIEVFPTPVLVHRKLSTVKGDKNYYNYAISTGNTINGKVIKQIVYLDPAEKREDSYQLLDAFFGESDSLPLYVAKRTMITTVNGKQRRSSTYSLRLVTKDDDGYEVYIELKAQNSSSKLNNLYNKLKEKNVIS